MKQIGIIFVAGSLLTASVLGQSANDAFDPNITGGNAGAHVWTTVLQGDGKVLVGGRFIAVGGIPRTNIARLNVDGSVDTTFDPGADGDVRALAVQADGKILLGGDEITMVGGQPRHGLARLNADGNLDATFDPSVELPGCPTCVAVHSLALQADGKILVGGQFNILGGHSQTNLGRLHADGQVDRTFGASAEQLVESVVLQPDGKILVTGFFQRLNAETRQGYGRLNADGSLDSAFTSELSSNGFVWSALVQADGKIVLGGEFRTLGEAHTNLVRLNSNGGLDSSFATLGADGTVWTLALQPDGQILLGGSFETMGGQPRNRLARLDANGNLDPTFKSGANGLVFRLAVQADGQILVGGDFTILAGQLRNAIGRLNPDGSLDATLNSTATHPLLSLAVHNSGKVLVGGQGAVLGGKALGELEPDGSINTSFNPSPTGGMFGPAADCVAVQKDGKILIGGVFTNLAGQAATNIGRLNADGSRDITFQATADDCVDCMAPQPDGRIVVGGYFTVLNGQPRNRIGRLNADGSLDMAFNPGADNLVRCLIVQPDGKILVGGWFGSLGGQPRSLIGRLEADGSLDSSFSLGAGGTTGTFSPPHVNSLALQADGKVLVGGFFTMLGGKPRSFLGRLAADGTLDSAFAPDANYGVSCTVVQTDGKILVAGEFDHLGVKPRMTLGRLNSDGSVDTNFAPQVGGFSSSFTEGVWGIAVSTDAKIIVGGNFTTLAGQIRTNIGRLTSGNAALQNLSVDANGTAIIWSRSGAGPEIEQVTFEQKENDGYRLLGHAARISGGWQLTGLSLPIGRNFCIRASGRTPSGRNNSSSGVIESVREFFLPGTTPILAASMDAASTGTQLSFGYAGGVSLTILVTTKLEASSTNWTALGLANEFAPGQYHFTDRDAQNYGERFYKLRSP